MATSVSSHTPTDNLWESSPVFSTPDYASIRNFGKTRRGFTLIELLVVCAIAALLLGLLMGGVQKVRETANRIACSNNLRQMGLAIASYHSTMNALPPSRVKEHHATWLVLIAPYLEGDVVADAWDLRKPYGAQTPAAQNTPLKIYYCPSRRSPTSDPGGANVAHTDYACNSGDREGYGGYLDSPTANGAMIQATQVVTKGGLVVDWTSTTSFDSITDGLSNTLLLGEKEVKGDKYGKAPADGPAYDGNGLPRSFARVGGPGFPLAKSTSGNVTEDERVFGGPHPGVCQFVFCDGHVASIKRTIDPGLLQRLTVRNDGEPAPAID